MGKAHYSALPPDTDTAEAEARRVLASVLKGSAQYLDWIEDCEFGHVVPFYKYIDCEGDKYAVVPAADSSSKEGLDENGFIVDENLYNRLTSGEIQWIEMK